MHRPLLYTLLLYLALPGVPAAAQIFAAESRELTIQWEQHLTQLKSTPEAYPRSQAWLTGNYSYLHDTAHPENSTALSISTIIEHYFGITCTWPNGYTLRIAPTKTPPAALLLELPYLEDSLTMRYTPDAGYVYILPKGVTAQVQKNATEIPITVHHNKSNTTLSEQDITILKQHNWLQRVGEGIGVWVDADTQQMTILEGFTPLWSRPCSTAAAGIGSIANSLQTPLDWHKVSEKFGDKAPWGQVFRSRQATSEVWQPGMDTEEDLVLTRVLWLEGLEEGLNRGRNKQHQVVDSKQRYIYIHGTNGEARIGSPSSHGCIRLLNDDVIQAFDLLPLNTPVLITAQTAHTESSQQQDQ